MSENVACHLYFFTSFRNFAVNQSKRNSRVHSTL